VLIWHTSSKIVLSVSEQVLALLERVLILLPTIATKNENTKGRQIINRKKKTKLMDYMAAQW
jgi:ABC-type molybdenum transport system ATPase subunit/photorepair protein PhrA